MTPRVPIRIVFAALLACAALAGCDREATNRAAIDAGKKVDRAIDRTQQKLAETGDKIAPALEKAGAQVAATAERAATSDAGITAAIKSDYLADPAIRVLKIDVDTSGGIVTLNGLADSEAARLRAGQIAAATKGVKEVRNYLAVKRG